MSSLDTLPGRRREHWALDKRVPIAVIIALAVQSAMGVGWLVTIDYRISSAEAAITEIENQNLDARMISGEALRVESTARLERIEAKLDRLIERENGRPPR